MKQESGRSLIEVIGVLAIGAVMTAGVIATYNTIRTRQTRVVAAASLEQIAKNTKLLLSQQMDFSRISVDYLIKSGALKNDKAPIGGADWSITSGTDNTYFLINITGLSKSDCDYFSVKKFDWAAAVNVNGYEINPSDYCLRTGDNNISFIIE